MGLSVSSGIVGEVSRLELADTTRISTGLLLTASEDHRGFLGEVLLMTLAALGTSSTGRSRL